jgi:hypothetical protein
MSSLEKRRAALAARLSTKNQHMSLDELREYTDHHRVEYAWVELYESLKKAGGKDSD